MAQIYGRDFIFGDFRASDHGLYPATFTTSANDEEETGIGVTTTEEYISDNPVPVYVGQKYSDKLHPSITLTKNDCLTDELYFSEYDCRAVLRQVIGQRGYKWMKVVTEEIGEDIWYRARVTNIKYQRITGKIAGIILDMECDSHFGWTAEKTVTINAKANTPFDIFIHTDDIYNYVLPVVTIIPKQNGNISIVNKSDNDWTVKFDGAKNGETIIYDCKNQIIDGSRNASGQAITKYLDSSNIHFFRLLEVNKFVSNLNATIKFQFREPRRVAFALN